MTSLRNNVLALIAVLAALAAIAGAAFGQPATQPVRWSATTRPAFPIAAWNCPAKDMDWWKANGATVLVGVGLEVPDTPAARVAWAAKAAERRLWVVGDFKGIVPANIYAHMLGDELDAKQADPLVPKWDGLRRDQIRPQYDAFKRLAPDVPVFMSLSGDHITQANRLAYYTSIADCCDIWSEDWYIWSTDPIRYNIDLKRQAIGILKQAAPNKPVWSFIETSWQNLKGRPNSRQISPTEFRATVQLCRDAGVAGRGYFSHTFNGNGGWVSFNGTPADVAQAIREEDAKDSPDPLTTLQGTVTAQAAHIAELDANLGIANARLDVLEKARREQDARWIKFVNGVVAATQPSNP